MNRLASVVVFLICLPFFANAAGTYYTSSYKSPQYRYGQTNENPANYGGTAARRTTTAYPTNYSTYTAGNYTASSKTAQTTQKTGASGDKFYLNAGISHQFANWEFEMATAGSKLHYDNIAWNVLDIASGYNFGMVGIDGGIQYGMQSGKSSMVDDDISNGGYWVDSLYFDDDSNPVTTPEYLGDIIGKSLSVGESSAGSLLGLHAGLSLNDVFRGDNFNIRPSIGYRHFSHTLETTNNSGISMQTLGCISDGTQTQCIPFLWLDTNADGNPDYEFSVADEAFTFEQSGVSHKYETTWSGPYFALDAEYNINANNIVTGRLEIGLPAYESIGDQPYRIDWQHPKSIRDSAGIGDAFHIGGGANYSTNVNDRVALSIGFLFDYYSVKNAAAETFLNGNYYTEIYWDRIDTSYAGNEEAAITANDSLVLDILDLYNQCPNWVCKTPGEISSVYKSMGIRIGLDAKF
jgi:hypothetical protein